MFAHKSPKAAPAQKSAKPIASDADVERTSEAATALRRLASRVSVGVSYKRYVEELPDVDFFVSEFEDSELGKKAPRAVLAYREALKRYKHAALIWEAHIRLGRR